MFKQAKTTRPVGPPESKHAKALREARGQTQAEAAKSAGVTLRQWQRYEAAGGKVAYTSANRMPPSVWEIYLLDCLQSGMNMPEPYCLYLQARWKGLKIPKK